MEKDHFEVVIFGDPIPLKRHRRSKNKVTGKTIEYDPSSDDKKNFAWKAIAQFKPSKPFDFPIKLKIVFYMPRPKNHYRTGKYKHLLRDNIPKLHTSKPDLDNLIKFVKDALNNIYWIDDSIISTLVCKKMYSETPRIRIEIDRDN